MKYLNMLFSCFYIETICTNIQENTTKKREVLITLTVVLCEFFRDLIVHDFAFPLN
jgi:hypothetical protein